MTNDYVLGFAFTNTSDPASSFVLVRLKARPEWQKGWFNGIGGRIEEDERPVQAMVREFREETGIETIESDWVLQVVFIHKRHCNRPIFVFRLQRNLTLSDTDTISRFEETNQDDERCFLIPAAQLDSGPAKVLGNLH